VSAGTRVLIVDDEELILRSLSRLLARAGYDVVAETTVGAARAVLAAPGAPVEVVVTDLRVAGTSGLELLATTRAMERAPRVIVFSGLASTEDIAAAMRAGATAVVRKPVVPADLLAAVAAAAAAGAATR
jgi:DNA-binding NtrC family response regulator